MLYLPHNETLDPPAFQQSVSYFCFLYIFALWKYDIRDTKLFLEDLIGLFDQKFAITINLPTYSKQNAADSK